MCTYIYIYIYMYTQARHFLHLGGLFYCNVVQKGGGMGWGKGEGGEGPQVCHKFQASPAPCEGERDDKDRLHLSGSVGRRVGSDAGGLRFESQTGRVRGKATPSLWRDSHLAIKGLQPPEHHAGQFHPDIGRSLRVQNNKTQTAAARAVTPQ